MAVLGVIRFSSSSTDVFGLKLKPQEQATAVVTGSAATTRSQPAAVAAAPVTDRLKQQAALSNITALLSSRLLSAPCLEHQQHFAHLLPVFFAIRHADEDEYESDGYYESDEYEDDDYDDDPFSGPTMNFAAFLRM
jgi:hypothetical protein